MNIVFMGTPDFCIPSLKMLASEYNIKAVITQPDRPRGRGKKLAPPPVKVFAEAKAIPVYQPDSIKTLEFIHLLKKLKPDAIVVVAYGKILPKEVLCIPRFGCINLHASLLPKYRGAAPIHWAVINGEQKTGVTTIYMDEGMDTGDIILQREIDILPDDTAGSVHDRLADLGASVLLHTLKLVAEGKAPRMPQNHAEATYAPIIKREHERIDWSKRARDIKNHIRGMNPWPGAFTTLYGKILKIWKAGVVNKTAHNDCDCTPGTVLSVNNDGIIVKAGEGLISITELQMQGKKKLSVSEFIRGNRIEEGTVLDEA